MNAEQILDHLKSVGVVATLQQGGNVNLKPSELVTPSIIDLVKQHKLVLLEALAQTCPVEVFKTKQEKSRYQERMDWFFGRADAEKLAERLFTRDREGIDLVMCVECKHLHGLVCRNWKQAGVAIMPEGSTLASIFTVTLQRCDGFTSAFNVARL